MANRVTQETAEVFAVPDTQKARVTTATAEVFAVPNTQKARVTTVKVEVFIKDPVFSVTNTGSFTANAIVKRTTSSSFSANAVLKKTTSSSFTADAFLKKVVSGSFTENAVVKKTTSASFTANSAIIRRTTGSFSADAVIPLFFRANAVVKRTISHSFTANATIIRFLGSFFVDAWLEEPPLGFYPFYLDAVIKRSSSASFTADAEFSRTTTQTITANAQLFATQSNSFVARAFIVNGESGVHIRVNGIDITEKVAFDDATFTMAVNGFPGSFRIRVRDTEHTRSFTTGAEVTLDIDGVRRFGGYLMAVTRLFAFPYDDTTDPTSVARYFVLTGVDYNILFAKRILYDKARPANINLRAWPVGSRDDIIIRYVFDHYTDLGADGVTYDGVQHIGSPNPDHAGVVGSGGLTFGDAMREINRLLSGVWYIDAYKDLKFVDVDEPTASKSLTDRPSGPTEVGYRDFTHVESGAALINDALVWGAGQGSPRVRFGRATDAASIAEHGLWQSGEFTTALYKQASVDERADTIVYGTPQSKRGGKDDHVGWMATTYDRSFSAGQKVDIESEIFGVQDVVPIRRLTITFPTPTDPKFQLAISHDVDVPWNFFEFPPFHIFEPNIDGGVDITIPKIFTPHFMAGGFGYVAAEGAAAGEHGTGTSRGPGFGATIFSSFTDPIPFVANTQYRFGFGISGVVGNCDYAPLFSFADHIAYPSPAGVFPASSHIHWETQTFYCVSYLIGGVATFTANATAADAWADSTIATYHYKRSDGCHGADIFVPPCRAHVISVTWYLDPIDWDPGVPDFGDQIVDEPGGVDIGQTLFFTAYPYQPGSLSVTLDGTLQPQADIIELDPGSGIFSLVDAPPSGSVMTVTYLVF